MQRLADCAMSVVDKALSSSRRRSSGCHRNVVMQFTVAESNRNSRNRSRFGNRAVLFCGSQAMLGNAVVLFRSAFSLSSISAVGTRQPNKRLQNDRQIATRFGTLALLGGI